MFHANRAWGPPRVVETAEELAELLVQHTWTLCSAFEHAGYLYLNDATSEDGASEYAVLKRVDGGCVQIESITFSWCDRARALGLICGISAGEFDESDFAHAVSPRIDVAVDHCCELCA